MQRAMLDELGDTDSLYELGMLLSSLGDRIEQDAALRLPGLAVSSTVHLLRNISAGQW